MDMASPYANFTTSFPVPRIENFTISHFFKHIQTLELILALLLVIVSVHYLHQSKRHGLPVWPLIGMLPSFILGLRSNVHEWLSSVLVRQNATFEFRGPSFTNLKCVITCDPRNIEHLLKTKFDNYPKGEYFRSLLRDFLGDGIFNVDDEPWRRQRKTASLEFHSARFRSLTTESLAELVHARLIPVLQQEAVQNSAPIDIQDVLLRLTFDNVCMIAFGVDPGCLSHGLPISPFARSFEDATEATLLRFVMPTFVWKFMRYFNLGSEKKLKQSIEDVDEFANQVIRARKNEIANEDPDHTVTRRSDLLTVFMRLRDDGKPFSDKFLRDICVNFIIAGRDTSSVALSWFFWLIELNKATEEKIVEELHRIVGERDNRHEHGNNDGLIFSADEVKKMDYLQAALSESLRLYPVLPVDHKEAVDDDVFPDGTILKRGTKVLYSIYAMGRMEAIWGKDCKEYKPERWLRDGRFVSESAYKFTAFNGGPRLCLGKDFAYFQMKFIAASILYRYRVKVVKNHPVEPKLALTMYIKQGLKVNLYKRDES